MTVVRQAAFGVSTGEQEGTAIADPLDAMIIYSFDHRCIS